MDNNRRSWRCQGTVGDVRGSRLDNCGGSCSWLYDIVHSGRRTSPKRGGYENRIIQYDRHVQRSIIAVLVY